MEVLAIKELHTMIYIVSTWKLKHGLRSTWRMPHQKEEEDTVFSLMKINFMFMEDGTQRCNTIIFAFLILKKNEWSDPDIFNEIPRWNHSSVLIEAIPTWKFFVFGGEQAEYQEGVARTFG